jgi:hypothetical protein
MRTVFYPSKGKGSSLPHGLVNDLVEHELKQGAVEIIGLATARPIAVAGTGTLKRGPGRPRKQAAVPTAAVLTEKPKRGRRSSRKRRALPA